MMFGIGPMELIVVLALSGGGLGIPLSVPPLPPDSGIRAAAPENCLFYARLAGLAAPDPKSKNHTEQLLAEQEVAQFVSELGQQIDSVLEQLAKRDPKVDQARQLALPMVKAVATRPTVFYVERFVPPSGGGAPDVKGCLVINCGPQKAALVKIIKQVEELALSGAGGDRPTDVTIEKASFRRVKPSEGPELTWGFKDDYLVVAVGAGAAEDALRRMGKPGATPAWLTAAEALAGKSRISTVGYFNLGAVLELIRTQARDPKAAGIIEMLGLKNAKAISSVSGLDEQGMFSRTQISLDGKPQGLLELVSDQPLAAADLKNIPDNATGALAVRLDFAAIFKEALARVGKVEPGAPGQVTAQIETLEQLLGFNLERDLLEALGDVWTIYGSGDGSAAWTGLVVSVSVRNQEKLAASHEKLLQFIQKAAGQQAPFTIRDTNIGDVKVRQLVPKGPLPVSPAWCITDTHLVVAASLQTLKSHLTRSGKSKSLADVPAVASRLKAGVSMIMYEDTNSTIRSLYAGLQAYGPLVTGLAAQQGIDFNLPALPSLEAIEPHIFAGVGTLRRTKAGVGHESQQSLPIGGGSQLVVAPVMVALILPAVQAAREAARRTAGSNNLKQLGLAMHNHYADYKKLPAPAIVDKNGKPLLSWRVAVLKYVDEDGLYKEFHLDEPWDSEHNRKLIARMPSVYANPSSSVAGEGKTVYLLPTGKGTMFEGNKSLKFEEITDGLSNTIMIVEATDDAAVEWTKPGDLEIKPDRPKAGLEGARPGGFQTAFGDGSVRLLQDSLDDNLLKALFTARGGETVNPQ